MNDFQYLFANGTLVIGSLEHINQIARFFNEDINYSCLIIPPGVHITSKSKVIQIKDMNDNHLVNAYIKYMRDHIQAISQIRFTTWSDFSSKTEDDYRRRRIEEYDVEISRRVNKEQR